MIISRTPYRISFFGGGTDYADWVRLHGGAVLATTIDKYCYLTCRYLPPFFEHRLRVVYSELEHCRHAHEVKHPAVRGVLQFLSIDRGLEIHHDGDLPARTGIGSSSSFTVGLLNSMYALMGRMVGAEQLARESIHIEQEILAEHVGCQDQILAAYGGFNHVELHPTGEFTVRPVLLPRPRLEELDRHLMLFFTGVVRTASDVARSYTERLRQNERLMFRIREMVDHALALLCGPNDIAEFGALLHEGWKAKSSLSGSISNSRIDDLYSEARAAGALGGKIIGAGGGGFLLLFAPPEVQPRVRERLHNLLHVPFRFSNGGSQIVFHGPEVDYSEEDRARLHREPVPVHDLALGAPPPVA